MTSAGDLSRAARSSCQQPTKSPSWTTSTMPQSPDFHRIPAETKLKKSGLPHVIQQGNLSFFKARGKIYDIGQRVLENDGMALVGVSPQNSYFNDHNIETLLSVTPAYFKTVKVWFPYEICTITYKALGHDPKGVLKQLRRYANRPRNKCIRDVQQVQENIIQYERDDGSTIEIELINWNEQVSNKPIFIEHLKQVNALYSVYTEFRKDARHTEYEFFADKIFDPRYSNLVQGIDHIETVIDNGVEYTLQQIAFLLSFPELFGEAFAYIYHERWPILENLVEGKYGNVDGKDAIGYLLTKLI